MAVAEDKGVRVCLCVCMCHFDSQHQRSSWVEGSSSRCVGGVGRQLFHQKSRIFLAAALQHCHEAMAFLRTKTKETLNFHLASGKSCSQLACHFFTLDVF